MKDQRPQFDFSEASVSQDPVPTFPFPTEEKSQAKEVAWLIFSRLYVQQINNFMCAAPLGFREELEANYGLLCTKHTRNTVVFELTDNFSKPRRIHAADWEMIHRHRGMVLGMILRASSMYEGTMNSIDQNEAMTLATALCIESVGRLIPIKLDE